MKKNIINSVFVLLLSSASANADIVCNGSTNFGAAKVVISDQNKKVTVTGAELQNPQIFTKFSEKHGIITAPGLAIFYEDDYGCIRNATIITAFSHDVGDDPNDAGYVQAMQVAQCSGGSTPDAICGIR